MALTEELTFQLGSSGIILNTDSTSVPFVDISKVTGLDSAEYRSTIRDWEGNDGGFIDAEFEKGRNIILEGTVIATTSTIEAYLDDLKENYAPRRTLTEFYFKAPGVNERFLYVKPLGLRYDWDEVRRLGQASIQISMFAEDPRAYDNSLQTPSIPLGATVFTGFGFNFGFNFGFGGTTTTTDGVFVTNNGNRPTPPIMVIQGPVTNPRILNDTTNSEMIFNITLSSTDTLTIDTKYKTVKLNGTANRRNTLLAPTWFYLDPGDSFIRYRAESSDPTSTMTIQYRSAWR